LVVHGKREISVHDGDGPGIRLPRRLEPAFQCAAERALEIRENDHRDRCIQRSDSMASASEGAPVGHNAHGVIRVAVSEQFTVYY
jgi:hypothetical protein